MQIDLERARGTPRMRCRIGERPLLQHEMLNRFTLARWQTCEGAGDGPGGIDVNEPLRWVGCLIGMVFICDRCVHLAHVLPADSAEEIDRPPVADDTQPCCERPPRVIGLARTVNG